MKYNHTGNHLQPKAHGLHTDRGKWESVRRSAEPLPPPPAAPVLLDQLRQHKSEILDILIYRWFTKVSPAEGDLHMIAVGAANERDILRWAVAVIVA